MRPVARIGALTASLIINAAGLALLVSAAFPGPDLFRIARLTGGNGDSPISMLFLFPTHDADIGTRLFDVADPCLARWASRHARPDALLLSRATKRGELDDCFPPKAQTLAIWAI